MESGRLYTELPGCVEGVCSRPKRPVEDDQVSSSTFKLPKTIRDMADVEGGSGCSTPSISSWISNTASPTPPNPFILLNSGVISSSAQPSQVTSNSFQGLSQLGQSRQISQHAASMTTDRPITRMSQITQAGTRSGFRRTRVCAGSEPLTYGAATNGLLSANSWAPVAPIGGNAAKQMAAPAHPVPPNAGMRALKAMPQLLPQLRGSQPARRLAVSTSLNHFLQVYHLDLVPADVDAATPQIGGAAVLGTSGQQGEFGTPLSSHGGTTAHTAITGADSGSDFGLAGPWSSCAFSKVLPHEGYAGKPGMGESGIRSCGDSCTGATEPQLFPLTSYNNSPRSEMMAPSGPCEVANSCCHVRHTADMYGMWRYDPFQAAAAGVATFGVDYVNNPKNADAMDVGTLGMEEAPTQTPTSKEVELMAQCGRMAAFPPTRSREHSLGSSGISAVGRGADTLNSCHFFAAGAGVSPSPPAQQLALQAGVHPETEWMRTDGGSRCSSSSGAATWHGVTPSSSLELRKCHGCAINDAPPVASCIAEVDDDVIFDELLSSMGDDDMAMDDCGPDPSRCQPLPPLPDTLEPLQPELDDDSEFSSLLASLFS